jgi:hypothetical protein
MIIKTYDEAFIIINDTGDNNQSKINGELNNNNNNNVSA